MRKAIGYCRCSTARQEKSVGEQKSTISAWAGRNGYEVERFFEDEGISGSEFDTRPGFRAMIEHCASANGSIDAVLVWDKSRLGRPENPKEAIAYEWQIERTGKQIVYVATGRRSDGSIGSVFQDVAENVEAGEKLKSLSAAVCRHHLENARDGFSTGRKPAFGYDLLVVGRDGMARKRVHYVATGVKNRYRKEVFDPATGALRETLGPDEPLVTSRAERSRLVLGEAAQVEVVKEIYRLYLAGRGFKTIASTLNMRGAPSPCGRRWRVSAVREALMNPTYTGSLVANRRTMAKFYQMDPEAGVVLRPRDEKGKTTENDPAKWITIDDAHPAIISKEDFLAVQGRRHARAARHGCGGSGARSSYLLSHVSRCKRCGNPYYGRTTTNAKGVKYSAYVCGGYFSQGRAVCRMGSIKLDKIEEPLMQILREIYFSIEDEEALAAAIREELALEYADHGEDIERLKARDRELVAKMENWLECISPENRDLLNKKLSEAKAEREGIEGEIARLQEADRAQVDVEQAASEILGLIRNFRALFEGDDVDARKEVVRTFVHRVTIDYEAGEALVELRPISGFFKVGRGDRI